MSFDLILIRDLLDDKATQGELHEAGPSTNNRLAYTIELPNKDGLPGSCIPQGTYPINLRWSPRFNRMMPHIDDIPKRSNILIHWGNDVSDVDGCVAVGETRDKVHFIGSSRAAFADLFNRMCTSIGQALVSLDPSKVYPVGSLQVVGGASVPDQAIGDS